MATDPLVITPAVLREWPLPAPGAGKEERGSFVVLGGSVRTPGAVALAGEASLRAGAGKLVLATTAATAASLALHVPESMVCGLVAGDAGEIDADAVAEGISDELTGAGAVLIGPGLRDPEVAAALVARTLPLVEGPVVLDALASAYLTENPDGLSDFDHGSVLTVNPNELAHTAGCDVAEVEADPASVAARVAERSGVVVLYGGTVKHVAAPDGRAWRVEGGGPGLGVSGSGDVQAGVVGGLLARGADPAQAAVWGAYLHARAGERCASEVAGVGYLARELLPQVPRVLAELREQ
jgi:ADP-dependent NAD(P)H-hydrate dehydratase